MPVIFILVVDLNLVIFLGMLCMYIKCHKKSQISYRIFFFLIFWLVQPVVVVCSKENVDSFAIFIFIYGMCVCVCVFIDIAPTVKLNFFSFAFILNYSQVPVFLVVVWINHTFSFFWCHFKDVCIIYEFGMKKENI